MTTHPCWKPFDPTASQRSHAHRVGSRPVPVAGVVAYDPSWPGQFAQVRDLVVACLGDLALSVEHVGSTSVHGLAAKPIIDVDVVVADAAAESPYREPLEAGGFVLLSREPWAEEHRCFALGSPNANVHVYPVGAVEPSRHRLFRRWLLDHPDDRRAYADLKTALARVGFGQGSGRADYNGDKAAPIYDIYERAFAADPDHDHDPQPRPRPVLR